MAVTIEEPLTAVLAFMLAVLLVIIATYLLFIAGSVAVCRVLQKNRKYYYRTNHFISVSQMCYRMKKNGAGLASICILSTMVLVTLSSTICLYMGTGQMGEQRYPGISLPQPLDYQRLIYQITARKSVRSWKSTDARRRTKWRIPILSFPAPLSGTAWT